MALFRLLFRHRVHAVLVLALLAGCSQSLFDASPGGGNGNGDSDGGTMPSEPDARIDSPDGGMMPVVPDAATFMPDAAPRDECPPPCAGDAFGDFYSVQGGVDGRWRYVEVQPEQPDSPYVDMTTTILPGPALGWIGTGEIGPTIALCGKNTTEPPCVGLGSKLALTSPGNVADAHHPGLMWIAPDSGHFSLTGDWSVSIESAVPTNMKLTRNSHSEVLYEESPTLTTTPYGFNVEIDVVEGDRIVLTATATTEQSVSVGVDFFVTGPLAARQAGVVGGAQPGM